MQMSGLHMLKINQYFGLLQQKTVSLTRNG